MKVFGKRVRIRKRKAGVGRAERRSEAAGYDAFVQLMTVAAPLAASTPVVAKAVDEPGRRSLLDTLLGSVRWPRGDSAARAGDEPLATALPALDEGAPVGASGGADAAQADSAVSAGPGSTLDLSASAPVSNGAGPSATPQVEPILEPIALLASSLEATAPASHLVLAKAADQVSPDQALPKQAFPDHPFAAPSEVAARDATWASASSVTMSAAGPSGAATTESAAVAHAAVTQAASTQTASTNAVAAGSAPLPAFGGQQDWGGGTDDWYDSTNWTSQTSGVANGYPEPGQTAVVASGTAILNGSEAMTAGEFDGVNVSLGSSTTTPAELLLNGAVTGGKFDVTISGTAEILSQGTSVFAGNLSGTSGSTLTLGSMAGGDLIFDENNFPSFPLDDVDTVYGLQFVGTTSLDEGGLLECENAATNQGTVNLVDGGLAFFGGVEASTSASGTGTFNLGSQAGLSFLGSVDSSQTINFSGVAATLGLGAPSTFEATVTNFSAGDSIDLFNLAFKTGTTASYNASTDQLTVSNGTNVVATLNNFHGQGGTLVTASDGSTGTTISYAGATSPTDNGASVSAEAIGATTVQSTLTVPGTTTPITGGTKTDPIKIGIISNSFNENGGANAAAASGYLPATSTGTSAVTVLQEGEKGDDDEGQAIAEAIYQDAPGAQLYFASGDSEPEYATSVQELRNAGCNVIIDDIGYPAEANDQVYGPAATAAQSAVSGGVNFFSALGNSGHSFYSGAFTPQSVTLNGTVQNANIFDNGTPYEPITLASGTDVEVRWSAPYAGTGGSGAPDALTAELFNTSGTLVATSVQVKSGTTGLAQIDFGGNHTGNFYLALYSNSGQVVPASFSLLLDTNGYESQIDDPLAGNTVSGNAYGHDVVPGVNTVGAVFYGQTPAFGQQTVSNESFSSYGPGQLLYDSSGNALATPQTLSDPSFSAPDGQYNTALGPGPFFGTSDAAPQAAAVAALMLQADPRLMNTQVSYLLAQTATPFGYDTAQTGAGLIQAVPAVQAAITAATTPIWTAQDGTVSWSDAGNWSDDKVPGASDTAQLTTGDGLLSGVYVVSYDEASPTTIAGLTLDGGTTATPHMSINPGTSLTVTGTTTVADNAILADAGAFSSSQIVLDATGTLELNASSGATGTCSGSISGSGAILQNGSGTTILSGTDACTGATTISSGTLEAGSSGAFSASSVFSISGTLELGGFSNSVASISGAGTITNSGSSAATLTITKPNGGTFDGTIADGQSGSLGLIVEADAAVNLDGTSTYSGATTVAGELKIGSDTALSSNSDVTVQATGILAINASGTAGSLAGDLHSIVSFGSSTAVLSVGADNATTTFSGEINRGGSNNGLVKLGTGTLTLTQRNAYGTTTIDDGTLQLGLAGAAGRNAIIFGNAGSPAILALESAARPGNDQTFQNTLTNFDSADDELDLENLSYASPLLPTPIDATDGTLSVTENGQTEDFTLGGTHADLYTAQSDGNGGTLVEAILCFAAGTRIRTAKGDVAVETLRVGDLAATASGVLRPIIWLGYREIDCSMAHVPSEVWPVRVCAGAFGEGVPKRELRLSPGHPMLVGEHLIPIMCLINGTTIERVPVETVTYWHVELDAHDILLAEGLPAESYIDLGSRPWFAGADGALYDPDIAAPDMPGRCRPVAIDGPVVETERRRLDAVFATGLTAHCCWPAADEMSIGL